MDSRVRNVPPDVWHKLKILCAKEAVSMNTKIIELVRAAVEDDEDDRAQLAQAFAKVAKAKKK